MQATTRCKRRQDASDDKMQATTRCKRRRDRILFSKNYCGNAINFVRKGQIIAQYYILENVYIIETLQEIRISKSWTWRASFVRSRAQTSHFNNIVNFWHNLVIFDHTRSSHQGLHVESKIMRESWKVTTLLRRETSHPRGVGEGTRLHPNSRTWITSPIFVHLTWFWDHLKALDKGFSTKKISWNSWKLAT